MKQKLTELKEEIDSSTGIVGRLQYCETPLPIVEKTIRQKVSEEIEDSNNIINQLDQIFIYKNALPSNRIHSPLPVYMGHFPG